MRKISKKTLGVLLDDKRMKTCQLRRYIPHVCSQKIEFHHNLIYGGKQSDIPNTIIALCSDIHAQEKRKDIKEVLDWIMINQMTERDFSLIPKWTGRYKIGYLNKKYGQYKP